MTSLEILENIQKLLCYISEILSDESKLYLSKEAAIKEIRKYCDEYDVTYTELQQIKSELEVWEIAKAKEIDLYDVITSQDVEEFNCDLYIDYQLTEEEFNKLKKEMEGEEDE